MQKKVCAFLLLSLSTSLIGMDRNTQRPSLEEALRQRQEQQRPAQQPPKPPKREQQSTHHAQSDDCLFIPYTGLMPYYY